MVVLSYCYIVGTMSYLKLNDINVYKRAFHLSNYVWEIVMQCDQFTKRTLGQQFVNAVDAISANVAEGFGRYSKKDKIRFYRISMGSVMEALDWNEKAKTRRIINEDQYSKILQELKEFPREINHLIKFTNEKLAI